MVSFHIVENKVSLLNKTSLCDQIRGGLNEQ